MGEAEHVVDASRALRRPCEDHPSAGTTQDFRESRSQVWRSSLEEKWIERMADDRTRRRRQACGRGGVPIAFPQEHEIVNKRRGAGPRAEKPRDVQRGVVPVVRNLRRHRWIKKSSRQVRPAMERAEEDSDQPPAKGGLAWNTTHREEQACGQAAHADVKSLRFEDPTKCHGGSIVGRVSMPFDRHFVPLLRAYLARHDGGLVALGLERPGQIAEVPPRLKVQLRRRERLGDDRDPKGFQESAHALTRPASEAGRGWDSPE